MVAPAKLAGNPSDEHGFFRCVDPDLDQFGVAALEIQYVGRHDEAAAFTDDLADLAGVIADLLRPGAEEQADRHATHDAHDAAQNFLHLEDVATLEEAGGFTGGQFGQILEPLISYAFIENNWSNACFDELEQNGLQLRPVEALEVADGDQAVGTAVEG